MNIHVKPLPRQDLLGGLENMVTEFKTSIFVSPDSPVPSSKQYHQIAKTVAGFINGHGGTLWLGVADDGTVKGVESDLAILVGGSARPCRGPLANDEGMVFGGTADQYILKLKELVKAYLGPSAEKYIAGAVSKEVNGRIVVKVPVDKAESGYVAYVYKWHPTGKAYSEEVYRRAANGTSHLKGFARDEFIRGKCREEFEKQLAALEKSAGKLTKKELVTALKEIQSESVIVGAAVTVAGGQPLTEENLTLISKPKGVVFDCEHLCDVKSWKEVYEAIYRKLNDLNSAAFDTLPKNEPKWFRREQQGKRCMGCYKAKLGTKGDIRAVEIANKLYLWRESCFFRKVFEACNVNANRFMVRA